MGVRVDLNTAKFQLEFFRAIDQELVKSANIFRRNLSTVLRTTGKSPPASPKGSKIPYNRTGTLARSWQSSSKSQRSGGKFTVKVGTNVLYAKYLLFRSDSGRRNYLDGKLGWRRKTKQMMLKRLDSQRLISTAVRSLKK
tara:strand:+ start:430 stop:849 length:420 start_codon:yes stop_codon:yes gene_type:complete